MIGALAALVPWAAIASGGSPRPDEACDTIVVSAAFTLGPPSPIASLHPLLTSNSFAEQNGISLLYLPLLWFDSDDRIDRAKSLASAVTANVDDTRFTVTLRPWHWSDGTAISSADVLYAWDMIRALGPSFYAWNTGGVPQLIRSVTAEGPRTVVFDLRRRVNPDWFEALGLEDFTPLPRQAWSRWTVAEQQSRESEASFYHVVDGPFEVASLDLGRDAVFVPNPRYDGHRPAVRRLIMDFLEGADPIERLRAGQLDAVNFPYDLWDVASRLPGARHVDLGPQGNTASIVLNFRNPRRTFLREVAVRQAMARAIDQKRLIDIVFHGRSLPQQGFVATGNTDQIPPELRGGSGPMSFDPAAARGLLDAAGYRPGPDGIRVRAGRRLALTLIVASDAVDDVMMAQLVETDLRQVGISVSIKELAFNQLIARLLGGHDGWDAVLLAWGSGNYPDGTQFFAKSSSGNYGGYSDPTMETLLDAATTEAGDGPLFALERYVVRQQPMIFLPDGNPIILARDTVHGLADVAGPSGELNAERLTVGGPRGCATPGA